MEIYSSVEQLDRILTGENGLLIKYHFGEGLDKSLLFELYSFLENLRGELKNQVSVDKSIVYRLVSIVPCLYRDYSQYSHKDGCEEYESIIYKLDSAILLCFNPDKDDPFFNTPLLELES